MMVKRNEAPPNWSWIILYTNTPTGTPRALSKEGDTREAKKCAPGGERGYLLRAAAIAPPSCGPASPKTPAYYPFDDLLNALMINNWPRAPLARKHEVSFWHLVTAFIVIRRVGYGKKSCRTRSCPGLFV
jgi:hypothetical protein